MKKGWHIIYNFFATIGAIICTCIIIIMVLLL